MTSRRATTRPAQPQASRGRLLIIDDDATYTAAVARFLASEHDVETVTDARVALERLKLGVRYDVILCDLQMPHMDGADFYEEVQRVSTEQQARIIFSSGDICERVAAAFLASVPNEAIQKPFGLKQLRSLIRERVDVFVSGVVPVARKPDGGSR